MEVPFWMSQMSQIDLLMRAAATRSMNPASLENIPGTMIRRMSFIRPKKTPSIATFSVDLRFFYLYNIVIQIQKISKWYKTVIRYKCPFNNQHVWILFPSHLIDNILDSFSCSSPVKFLLTGQMWTYKLFRTFITFDSDLYDGHLRAKREEPVHLRLEQEVYPINPLG